METQMEDPTSPITPEGQGWKGKPRGRGTKWGFDPGRLPRRGDTTANCEGRESSWHMAEGAPRRLEKYL